MPFNYDSIKDILVCPHNGAQLVHDGDALVHDGDALVSVDAETRWSYPIVDGIPRLLDTEGSQLDVDAWAEVMARHQRDRATGEPASQTSSTDTP